MGKPGGSGPGMTTEEMARRYREGESMGELAQAAGITQQTVRQKLIEAGVPRRNPGLARKLARKAGRSWRKMHIGEIG